MTIEVQHELERAALLFQSVCDQNESCIDCIFNLKYEQPGEGTEDCMFTETPIVWVSSEMHDSIITEKVTELHDTCATVPCNECKYCNSLQQYCEVLNIMEILPITKAKEVSK